MKIRNITSKIAVVSSLAAVMGLALAGCGNNDQTVETQAETTTAQVETSAAQTETAAAPTNAKEVFERLKNGNADFVNGKDTTDISADRRASLVSGQSPYVTVVTCSDSRVPAEQIFNAGLGEIFAVEEAGNVVDDFGLGSVEYGAEHLGTPLIVVMGHTNCGAVSAAVSGGHAEGHIANIVSEITPAVTEAKKNQTDETAISREAEKINVRNTIAKIKTSQIITHLEEEGKVKIIGAIYNIETGVVEFLDTVE